MTRVLIVDDSALMRRLVRQLLEQEGGFETAFASNGAEALVALRTFQPDVVTLDINMPGMDGLECLDRIMLERPTPVVMVSSLTALGAEESIEALSLGAVDVVQKPSGALSLGMEQFGPALVRKIRVAKDARIRHAHRLTERVRALTGAPAPAPRRKPRAPIAVTVAFPANAPQGVVLAGCSTGGPSALDALLGALPADFPWPIVVAQHMPAAFTGPLARRLDGISRLNVTEVTQATPLERGGVYIGHGDGDILVASRPQGLVALPAPSSPVHTWHPSVDRLVDSAMGALPAASLIGVLMTGMGSDGAKTMAALKAAGGWTLAEAEESAVVWGMPGELVRAGGANEVAPLNAIAARLSAHLARS